MAAQQKKGKGKRKGSNGPKPFLSSSLSFGRPPVEVEKSGDEGKYRLVVRLQLDHEHPRFPCATDVWFQGKSVGVVMVKDPTTHSCVVKPDLDRPLEVSVRPVGWNSPSHSLVLEESEFKDAKSARGKSKKAQAQARLEVTVGNIRPGGWQDVIFRTYDEHGKSANGHIRIPSYDPSVMEVDGIQHAPGIQPHIPTPDGVGRAAIRLLAPAGEFLTISFVHQQSREQVARLFKKE